MQDNQGVTLALVNNIQISRNNADIQINAGLFQLSDVLAI
jgi:hypothetical protein